MFGIKYWDNRHYEKVGNDVKDITAEIDFDLPDGWEYIRLSTICWLEDIKATSGEKLPYLDAKTLRGKSDKNYVLSGKVVENGTKIILVDGENSGEVFDVPFRGYMGSTFKILGASNNVNIQYLNIVLDFYKDVFKGNKIGAAIPHLNKNLFRSLLIGLPPVSEQSRIVSKLIEYKPSITKYGQLEQEKSKLDGEIFEKLKKSILQYAIQGKLVPQDENDEPASELLKRIRAEKKAKLGKKYVDSYIYKGDDNCYYEKVGSEVKNVMEEIPFDLPETWEWIRLGTLFHHNTGKALNSSNIKGIKRQYITTSNLYWGYFKLDCLREMFFTDEEAEKCSVHKGDLLVCEGGDIGRAAIWNFDYSMCIQNHIHKLRPYYPLNIDFYYYIFYVYKNSSLIGGKGIGIQGLSSNALDRLIIPLPPIKEQNRIIDEINILTSKLKDEI